MSKYAEAFDAEKWAFTKSLAWVIKYATDHPQKLINLLNFYIDNAAVVSSHIQHNSILGTMDGENNQERH
jgi:hypothetical protein